MALNFIAIKKLRLAGLRELSETSIKVMVAHFSLGDKCERQECSDDATCSEDDPHECSCKPGFSGDGLVCDNINECDDGSHNCSIHATCNDNKGSYLCQCKEWFSGDGLSCVFQGCPAGNFATDRNACEECPVNTYNNIRNSFVTECISCPNYYTTETAGSTTITQCKCEYCQIYETPNCYSKYLIVEIFVLKHFQFLFNFLLQCK